MNVGVQPVARFLCAVNMHRGLVAWLQLKALICAGQREVVPGALVSALGPPARSQATGPDWAPSYLLSHLPSCLCSGEISVLTVRIFCYGWMLTHGGGSWSFGLDSWMGPTLKDIHSLCLSGNAWKRRGPRALRQCRTATAEHGSSSMNSGQELKQDWKLEAETDADAVARGCLRLALHA